MDYTFLLGVNCLTAIVCKFGSIVALRLALEEYQNLNQNGTYFTYAVLMTLAPSSLLASIYTYDHDNCMPVNFLLPQQGAELLCVFTLFIAIVVPIALLIVLIIVR